MRLSRRTFSAAFASSALLSTTGLSLTGCKSKKNDDGVLRIGVILPTSGHQASLGQECKKGADIARFVLREYLGFDFELIHADSESSPQVGRTKAEKLINNGVHAIVGAYDSGVSAAIAQVCEQRSVPFVVNLSAAPQLTEQGYRFLFRNFPTGAMLIRQGMSLMKDLFREKNIFPQTAAFIHINDTYGETMRAGIEKLMPELDMPFKIIETITYDAKTQDLSTEVAKIKESGAEFIMPATRLEDAVLLIKEVLRQKLNIMGIINPGSPGMYERDFFNALGEKSNYWISNTAWYNPKATLSQMATKELQKQHPGHWLETSSAFTFEAIHIVCDAFNRAHTTESEALRDAIVSSHIKDHVCLGGPIEFDEKGQAKNLVSASMQNLNQRPTVIFPDEVREEESVFPIPSYHAPK